MSGICCCLPKPKFAFEDQFAMPLRLQDFKARSDSVSKTESLSSIISSVASLAGPPSMAMSAIEVLSGTKLSPLSLSTDVPSDELPIEDDDDDDSDIYTVWQIQPRNGEPLHFPYQIKSFYASIASHG